MRFCIAILFIMSFFSCKKNGADIALSENFLINGGGRGTEVLRDMDIDEQGNIYVTGKTASYGQRDTAWFDPLMTRAVGGDDVVTVKYNRYGKAIWAKVSGSVGWDEGEAIAAATDGHCYVAGVFGASALFGSTTLTPEVSSNSGGVPNLLDMFLARYDAKGNVVWVRQVSGVGYERPTAIDLDASGNVVVTGYFYQKINFSGTTFSTNASAFFIAKYSQSGNLVWAKTYGGASYGDMYPDDLVVGAGGSIIVGGSFSGLQDFGGTVLQSNGQDNFVAKYDANGNNLWARQLGGPGTEIGYTVALDEAGNTYFGGLFQSTVTHDGFTIQSSGGLDGFWAKYNTAGQLQWLKAAGGSSEDGVADLFVYNDTLYSTGYYLENFNIAGQIFPDDLAWNGFVARHDLNGNFAGIQVFSPGMGLPVKIGIDKAGYGIIAGYFSDAITIGSRTKVTNGANDLFLWGGKF